MQMRRSFNENFGSVFRHRADATAYAFALKQHADMLHVAARAPAGLRGQHAVLPDAVPAAAARSQSSAVCFFVYNRVSYSGSVLSRTSCHFASVFTRSARMPLILICSNQFDVKKC